MKKALPFVKILLSSLIIVGTSIGAAVLGLPVKAGRGGFSWSILLLVLNWIVMTGTALLLNELLFSYKRGSNFITLSDRILGKRWKNFTFVVYLALFFSLTLAYTKMGGMFLVDLLGLSLPWSTCLFLLCFAPLIIFGARILGVVNGCLIGVMLLVFGMLVGMSVNKIDPALLAHTDLFGAVLAFPLFITTFGFQGTLPSLTNYVKNKRAMKISIYVGTSIVFLVYLIWLLVVMGLVPLEGEHSLNQALQMDQTAITPLRHFIQSPFVMVAGEIFYFTALITSFLGVGLGLVDFLLDAFKRRPHISSRFLVVVLIYVPAFWIGNMDLRIFYLSLTYGGGSACFYLLILLPILLFVRHKRGAKRLARGQVV